jgi:UDP-N-acetylmuramoyl-tripeptide--D-alanyl-D-alanine ligase
MKATPLQTLAAWAQGKVVQGDAQQLINDVSTDSRKVPQGGLFIALSGDRFDAHDFLAGAVAAGAGALLVSREMVYPPQVGVIRVADTLRGLQNLATAWRMAWGGRVIGLTGSNGKTSTKDLATSLLSQRWKTQATLGNLNNHIGVPLTLLSVKPMHEIAVCEMGMNHPGEIAPLAEMARPEIGIITNIGTAHIEHMGSQEAIALEKGMLVEAIGADGCVVLPTHDPYREAMARRTKARILTGGLEAGDVCISDFTQSMAGSSFTLRLPDGSHAPVTMPVFGRHMASNAALAAAASFHLGLTLEEMVQGLAHLQLNKGRLQPRSVGGLHFIDDTYNANPDSMRAAMITLAGLPCQGRRIALLGRMGELGEHSSREHRHLGDIAREQHVDLLLACGEDDSRLIISTWSRDAYHFTDHTDAAAWLRGHAAAQDLILVKGSRTAAMEKVINLLTA